MPRRSSTPKAAFWIIPSAVLVVFIGIANYFAGSELVFSVFYLFPVLLATRRAGAQAGILISWLSVLDWLWTEVYYIRRPYVYFFTPYWNALVSGALFLIVVLIYSKWEQEWANARTDAITKIPNRMAFSESVRLVLRLCQRYAQPLSIAYIDVDDFKRINDRWGHQTGDRLLFEIAQGLGSHLRMTDVLGHMGGDEFAILMPDTNPQSSERSLRRIITDLSKPRDIYGPITYSIGMVTYNPITRSIEQILSTADLLMHEAKKTGKNRIIHKQFVASELNPERINE